jgi:hypothetical protein
MFFRTFKQVLGCRHLISDKHNGSECVTAGEPMRLASVVHAIAVPTTSLRRWLRRHFPAEAGQARRGHPWPGEREANI